MNAILRIFASMMVFVAATLFSGNVQAQTERQTVPVFTRWYGFSLTFPDPDVYGR